MNRISCQDCLAERRCFKDYGLSEADPEGREIINKEKDMRISKVKPSSLWRGIRGFGCICIQKASMSCISSLS